MSSNAPITLSDLLPNSPPLIPQPRSKSPTRSPPPVPMNMEDIQKMRPVRAAGPMRGRVSLGSAEQAQGGQRAKARGESKDDSYEKALERR
ncbi:hypothetical protein TrLO_g10267 [Triparma laevis f. longispina]|uniref:Uncharacterized protein n=1 Tax=Triparma laevis f. longispina TaxID=1714387 RepID=A0A9W7FP33_9STRA|nr:hypothetical protein TrLO_g10267 [Triparma laevis f. longispina]